MNYQVVKDQIKQIIVSEVAKYYQKACTPAGLSLDDLKCLEAIAKISQFEQDIRSLELDAQPAAEPASIDELLKIVRTAQSDGTKS